MVEAGWSGSRCTGEVDVCVGSPWPDEAASFAIDRSLFTCRGADSKEAHERHTQHRRMVKERSPHGPLQRQARLVFAHLLIPHPPLRLGSICAYRWKPMLGCCSVGLPTGPIPARGAQVGLLGPGRVRPECHGERRIARWRECNLAYIRRPRSDRGRTVQCPLGSSQADIDERWCSSQRSQSHADLTTWSAW